VLIRIGNIKIIDSKLIL